MKTYQIILVLLFIPYFGFAQVNENTFSTANSIQLKNKIYSPNIYEISSVNDENNCKNQKYLINQNLRTIAEILLPRNAECVEVANFFVDGIREDKKGFQISIEYGTRFFYNKIFYFKYYNNSFYLYQIKTVSFDKANPDIWKTKIKKMNPKIKVINLNLEKYLTVDNMDL